MTQKTKWILIDIGLILGTVMVVAMIAYGSMYPATIEKQSYICTKQETQNVIIYIQNGPVTTPVVVSINNCVEFQKK